MPKEAVWFLMRWFLNHGGCSDTPGASVSNRAHCCPSHWPCRHPPRWKEPRMGKWWSGRCLGPSSFSARRTRRCRSTTPSCCPSRPWCGSTTAGGGQGGHRLRIGAGDSGRHTRTAAVVCPSGPVGIPAATPLPEVGTNSPRLPTTTMGEVAELAPCEEGMTPALKTIAMEPGHRCDNQTWHTPALGDVYVHDAFSVHCSAVNMANQCRHRLRSWVPHHPSPWYSMPKLGHERHPCFGKESNLNLPVLFNPLAHCAQKDVQM